MEKKGSPTDKNMYRPISGLQTFGKIIETAVDIQLRRYCEKHGLFGKNQHGFRKSRSCSTALLSTYTKLRTGRMQKKWQGMLCFDLSAAYDTVNHKLLIEKAKIYGFDRTALAWLSSYITGRKQMVRIGDYTTNPVEMTSGIPQGSSCSCLLFLLYVGDFEEWVSTSHNIYADDTMISTAENKPEEVIATLEREAQKVFEFCASNELLCNPEKTAFLIISPQKRRAKENYTITLNGKMIEESSCEKCLGLHLQNNLKWTEHLKKIRAKTNHGLYQLKNASAYVDRKTLREISEGLVMSHIRFCLSTYGPESVRVSNEDPHTGMLSEMQVTQNKMLRIINKNTLSDKIPTSKLLEKSGMLSVNQLMAFSILMDLWKGRTFEIQPIMEHFSESRSTRYKGYYNGNGDPGGFVSVAAKLWGKAPRRFRETNLVVVAKGELKEFVINNIPV